MTTTQLAIGNSPLDAQCQMGHTTLTMTNHYASLTIEQLQKSHERFSPLRAERRVQMRHLGKVTGTNSIISSGSPSSCVQGHVILDIDIQEFTAGANQCESLFTPA
jgi:hypothetical protein